MEVDRNYILKLLKSCKPDQIKITDKTAYKIENVHGVKLEDVKGYLLNPKELESVEEQPSRHDNQRTFQLVFRKSSKKLEKLIKRGKIRRL